MKSVSIKLSWVEGCVLYSILQDALAKIYADSVNEFYYSGQKKYDAIRRILKKLQGPFGWET